MQPQRIIVDVEDPAGLLAATPTPLTLLRWESGPSSTGPWTEGGTVAIDASKTQLVIWDESGTSSTWYRTRYSSADGDTVSAYSDARTAGSRSLVSVAEVRSLVPNPLTDVDLQGVIDREEATLAHDLYWPGGLGEEGTQLFYVGDPALRGMYIDTAFFTASDRGRSLSFGWVTANVMEPLRLLRHTDAAVVVDNGETLASTDVRLLRHGSMVERASGGWTGPIVEVTYTPSDFLEVSRVLIELCRLTLTETGYYSEQIGEYRYMKRADKTDETRKSLVRSLQTYWPMGTMRIQGSSEDRRVGGVVQS